LAEDEPLHSLGAPPLGAASADFSKGFFTVNELTVVGYFALGLVHASLEGFSDRLVEYIAEIDVHSGAVLYITTLINY
jgi:hypothetical protein